MIVQVKCRHRGFRYTERIWNTTVDVIAAVHREALNGGQCPLGLQELLGMHCLEPHKCSVASLHCWISHQAQLMKAQTKEMMGNFRNDNPKSYKVQRMASIAL
mmetsp:Transcript_46955/g.69833  ORF Transcript_46955/g.69833 Transcript_46955/m.69833 type:complete len:103 (-) Transcript_46955:136-444(-)